MLKKELLDLIANGENSLVEFKGDDVRPDKIDKGFRRPLERFYQWNAIRELILNALVHRDWTRNTDIEICRYNDRLEVISPGALPNSMTVEKMVGGRRTPRNTIIMEVLRDYQYVDARGVGIRTKVIPIMKSFNGTEPEFESTEDYLKTILVHSGPKAEPNDPKKTANNPINDPKTDILTLIAETPSITYSEIAVSINKSPATVKRYLQELKASGVISRSGGKKGGRWVIL